MATLVAFHGCPLRCRVSNALIIRYEHNAGTEFEPLLETVVLLLQIADSKRNMLYCFYLFSLVFTSYFPIQNFENMFARMSVVVIVPVMVERWWRVSRRSWAMKSPEMARSMPSMARSIESRALMSEL